MGTTIHRLEVHPSQHMLRSSSNNLQAISNKQRLWNLQTTMWQVLNSIGNKVNRIPHKITQANIWLWTTLKRHFHREFGSTSLNVTMDKHSQNSSHPQRNKRTITTTSTATCGQSPTYNQVRTTIMEYYRATTAFNRLKQQTTSSVSTNLGGGTAPMDISAIKEKAKDTKEKANTKERAKARKGLGRIQG